MKTSAISIPGSVASATLQLARVQAAFPPADLPPDVAEQLARVLASPLFCRARRDGPLLRYLVAASIGGRTTMVSEYAIGINVYRRDPATYAPAEDPVVRVQVGRLRHRLAAYYREDGEHDVLRFAIPAGGYRVRIGLGLGELPMRQLDGTIGLAADRAGA